MELSASGGLLKNVDGTYNTPTIFEYLVEPLLSLNKCQRLNVRPIKDIHDPGFDGRFFRTRLADRPRRRDSKKLPSKLCELDWYYMCSFTIMLAAWVERRIDRQDTFHERWKRSLRALRPGGCAIWPAGYRTWPRECQCGLCVLPCRDVVSAE